MGIARRADRPRESYGRVEVQGLLVKVASKGGPVRDRICLANREVMKLGLSLRF